MNGDRALACSHSLEWLLALDRGRRRDESRNTLKLVQSIAAMFNSSQFQEAQQDLIDEVNDV